jgi:hypothetical protein
MTGLAALIHQDEPTSLRCRMIRRLQLRLRARRYARLKERYDIDIWVAQLWDTS